MGKSTPPTGSHTRFIDASFVVFALIATAAITTMTIAHPDALRIVLAVGTCLGFGLMAFDRFWLRKRREPDRR